VFYLDEPSRRRKRKKTKGTKKSTSNRTPRVKTPGFVLCEIELFGDPTKTLSLFPGGTWEYLTPHFPGDDFQGRCVRIERGATFPDTKRTLVTRNALLSRHFFKHKWRQFLLTPGLYEISYFFGPSIVTGHIAIIENTRTPLITFGYDCHEAAFAWLWSCSVEEYEKRKAEKRNAREKENEERKIRLWEGLSAIGLPVPPLVGDESDCFYGDNARLERLEPELADLFKLRASEKKREWKSTKEKRLVEEGKILERVSIMLKCLDPNIWTDWTYDSNDDFVKMLSEKQQKPLSDQRYLT
jgi:hypothetical protein